MFLPANGAAELLITDGFEDAELLGITGEPAGGSPAPTGDVILLAPFPPDGDRAEDRPPR